ncbi:hypothetical protein MMC07_006628 [Pseudocyphellaria aurata]|nr:hypothetical protein [Pseudocyphellaria aurata]
MSWDNSGGDATGEWDAGASGSAKTWDAADSGAANTWDNGNAEGGATWKTDKDTTKSPDHDKDGHAAAEGSPAGEGRPRREGPQKPMICRNCKKEGHMAIDCKDNKALDWSGIPDEQPEIAWNNVVKADQEKEIDSFKLAVKIYCKSIPETTWAQLERAFRLNNFNTFLVAREKEMLPTQTLVNLQGKQDCKYEVGFFYSFKPQRAFFARGWPSSPEENDKRLEDAGLPMERGIPKCQRCSELGHIARHCTQPEVPREQVEVKCYYCNGVGHRSRDCPDKEKHQIVCKNCNRKFFSSFYKCLGIADTCTEPGHKAADCTEPKSAEGVECNKCHEMGHFAKDCPTGGKMQCRNCGEEGHKANECEKPRDPAQTICRNCDAVGHFSKDCPKPKDWSRVKCNRCGEMGHTVRRCPKPDPDAANANGQSLDTTHEATGVASVAPEGNGADAADVSGFADNNDGW